MTTDPDLFTEPALGFSLRKPPEWSFLPPAWSPMEQRRNAGNDDQDWVRFARMPFCCAMLRHDSDVHAYPTLQVTVRRFHLGSHDPADLLQAQVEQLENAWPGLSVLRRTSDAILAGHRANRVEVRYPVVLTRGAEETEIGIYSLSYTVFAPARAFVIGLSGSDDPRYTDRGELAVIAASVAVAG